MKYIHLASGIGTVISNEESILLDQLSKAEGGLARNDLDERQQIVAVNLVKKDVLTRVKRDGTIYYQVPNTAHIWRI